MEKTREDEVLEVFKRLTPENQRCFMAMLRVADAAENNIRKVMDSDTGPVRPGDMHKIN